MNRIIRTTICIPLLALALLLTGGGAAGGCGNPEKKDRDFHTSGSREADQRGEQRVAKTQQLRGEGVGNDKNGNVKKSLYERLGGEQGLTLIVEDWINRAVVDPRVNWTREGVKSGSRFSFKKRKSVEWQNTPANGTRLKKHMRQFLATATGGPPQYEGRPMKDVHAALKISNSEFDAAVGDLAAAMDNLKVGTEEQKELLSIIETARPDVATKR
jgi:hemoglobin